MVLLLDMNDPRLEMSPTQQDKSGAGNNIPGSRDCLYDLLCSEPICKHQSDRSTLSSGPQQRLETFLLESAGNRFCADCGSPDPKWVCFNFGVIICIKCSGVHRSLGVHISKVLSVNLDEWTDEQVDSLVVMGGNTEVNLKYEACIPDNLKKPRPDSCIEERFNFIRRKYEQLHFLNYSDDEHMTCPFPSSSSHHHHHHHHHHHQYHHHHKRSGNSSNIKDKNRIGSHAFRNSWRIRKDSHDHRTIKNPNHSSAPGMVEFVGLIKVNVVKGTNLAIRDMMTSDPYVILSLGHQSVKTRVIKNNLNPIWNESLMLSIPDYIPPLKVLVYDKDTFSTDDFMGEGEIDIQPLLSAARAYEKSTINESTQLGKWVATKENHQVKDGVIFLVDGKVRQEISLRLLNVERGVLEIDLQCVPLTQ